MYAQVVLDLPIHTSFHYKVPSAFKEELQVGHWVEVPFQRDLRCGVVIDVQKEEPVFSGNLKEISRILSPMYQLPKDLLQLTQWISQYYCCSWGEALSASVPKDILKTTKIPLSTTTEPPLDPSKNELQLTLAQQESLAIIESRLRLGISEVFLLYGVTGSGKTEVYLQALEVVLSLGKSGLLLVPEIALTPQAVDLLKRRFRNRVAIFHSALSWSERVCQWKRIYHGMADVVIGTRSAIFAPLRNLSLIIIDEEQEHTYKQEETPRYNAREAAIERARINSAVVILGSATPSLESYAKVKEGKYHLLRLPERIQKRPMPEIRVVDMRQEVRENRRFSVFSRMLHTAIDQVLQHKEQGILFINRRGFAPFVQCQFCGEVVGCGQCSVGLTFHSRLGRLLCHYCNNQRQLPSRCSNCQRPTLRYLGIGSQKVESELVRLFPSVRVARLDSDAVRKRGTHEEIFHRFKNREIDFLVGTQMVAKGFDFPAVTLVGVVLADVTLHLPDFRSAERTYQLLTQVAGRAGRGELPGRVIIQTFSPDHYAIQKAKESNQEQFFMQEFQYRKETRFPPTVQLAKLLLKGKNESRVVSFAKDVAQRLRENAKGKFEVLGPAPAPISRIRNQFYWQILLRSDPMGVLSSHIQQLLPAIKRVSGVTLKVDVDPY